MKRVAGILILASAVAGGGTAQYASEHPHRRAAGYSDTSRSQDVTSESSRRASTMDRHEKMTAEMEAMDHRLQQKIERMNEATGNAKVQAMAEVINELAAQRREMHRMMATMRQTMMNHMAGHMRSTDGTPMMDCPMMQDHSGSDSD